MPYTLIPLLLISMVVIVTDLRWCIIPNYATYTGAVLGVVMNLAVGSAVGLESSLTGIGCGLLVFSPLFYCNQLGGGDVKFFAAIGALCGPLFMFRVTWYTIWFAAVFLFASAITRAAILRWGQAWAAGVIQRFDPGHQIAEHEVPVSSKTLPLGVPMAFACIYCTILQLAL